VVSALPFGSELGDRSMNRRERRAAVARGKATASSTPVDIVDLMAEATLAYQQRRSAQAEVICRQILARAPAHATALNLLGLLYQASGNHRLALKTLAKAIALNDLDAACHYNLASSYLALDQREAAATHFKKAIALGMSGKDVEQFLLKNTVIAECVRRMTDDKLILSGKREDLFGAGDIAAIANNIFMRCALESTIIRGVTLELFLTRLRYVLLRVAATDAPDAAKADDDLLGTFCAVAQQCFLNEYVFAQGDEEAQQASRLRELLLQKISAGTRIPPLLLAAVAAYFPLHSLPTAKSLLAAEWPPSAADLLRLQVREPLEEAEDRRAIPALTAIDDAVSRQVMQQYEENPYPRWTINPFAALAGGLPAHAGPADGGEPHPGQEILIAGCGTGEHSVDVAQKSPQARILAVDLSLASLAYARRKTREAGLRNIEYAQADILNLAGIGRIFDRIEAVGVLHHLADPKAGWRVLLSLLAPNGTMRVGLYSETARRSIVEARALIAERGYRATAEDIRTLRQTIIRERDEPRWRSLVKTVDFYSMSGCRDMFFNVMEHRLSIPEIAAFLNEHGLSFLGFELDPKTTEQFHAQHPGAEALANLDYWNTFEAANPQTFRNMYLFSVRKNGRRLAEGRMRA
jgi:2-polyprenyl-3-methyl-5-hydroxy-6-metoxy-1,4-benzoquinol methylase/tetratricopeptide (TPR) repeat protein